MSIRWLLTLLAGVAFNAAAQNYTITTVAGTGISNGDGGLATKALIFPQVTTTDAQGNVYLTDQSNHVRKIGADGVIVTIAGNSENDFSGDGGPATAAALSLPYGVAVDKTGNIYIADGGNGRVRKVGADGIIQSVAGNGKCNRSASGVSTVSPGGPALAAAFCSVYAVAVGPQNQLFISADERVWKIAPDGTLLLVAGTGGIGSTGDGGSAATAEIGFPIRVAVDTAGNVYFADAFNRNVRAVTASDQKIRTVVQLNDTSLVNVGIGLDAADALYYTATSRTVRKKSQAQDSLVLTLPLPYNGINDIDVDASGAIYIVPDVGDRLLKYAGTQLINVAGSYPTLLEQAAQPAQGAHLFLNPLLGSIAVDASGNVYFPELDPSLNQRIAKISPGGTITTFMGPDLKLPTGGAFTVQSVAFDNTGTLYFGTFTQVYRRNPDGTVKLYAGAPGFPSAVGDGGPAIAAKISNPSALVFDSSGNLYISEPFDNRVRKVDSGGTITTVAGTGQAGASGDGGPATLAQLSTPTDVAIDKAGNLHIAELTAHRVRKVNRSTGIITTVAGTLTGGFAGDGGPATAAQLSGAAHIAFDPAGNLFVVDTPSAASTISPATDNLRIRMVSPAGIISTVAGTGKTGYNGDYRLAKTALLGSPHGLAVDASGNVYFLDANNQRVRKLTPGAPPAVVEFYNSILDNFFVTSNAAEQAAIGSGSAGPGWSATGNQFNAGGPSQVCRFYGSLSPGPNSHFYTIDPEECQSLKNLQASTPITQKRWNFESLDFSSSIPTKVQCAGGYKPIYRAYNNGFAKGIDSNHRITSNFASYQAQIAKGWSGEGVVMCAPGG